MPSIFSQIRLGQLPGHIVWQDEQVFALLTIRPLKPGHILVMPIQEVDHWDDLTDELLATVMAVSRQLAKAIKIAFPCERVAMAICGLEIPHAHVHLFPIDCLADFTFGTGEPVPDEELATAARQLRAVLTAKKD